MKILFIFLFPLISFASFPEFFGPSPKHFSLGNQASFDADDAGNNFYAPAILAWSKKLNFSAETSLIQTNFKDIDNIITQNDTNSTSGASGPAKTDYDTYTGLSLNASLPIAVKGAGSLGLSVFMPLGKITNVNTGDPHLPEYVMYKSRYRRATAFLNYAHPISPYMAFSFGVQVGFKVQSSVNTKLSLTGSSYGSSGSIEAEAAPTLGGVFSLAMRFAKDNVLYFSLQQELKTEMEAFIVGGTENPPVAIDLTANSMLFYDPWTLRLGATYPAVYGVTILTSVEYQLWSNYKAPTLRMQKNSSAGALGSNDREVIKTRNILIPKLGIKMDWTDSFSWNVGASYRPTPFDSDFSGAGNSVDTNSINVATGFGLKSKLLNMDVGYDFAVGLSKLLKKEVVKSPNQEDGTAGSKIGAPGYTIGGSVYSLRIGLRAQF